MNETAQFQLILMVAFFFAQTKPKKNGAARLKPEQRSTQALINATTGNPKRCNVCHMDKIGGVFFFFYFFFL